MSLQLIDNHKVVLDETKTDYNKLKKTMDELRASEVVISNFALSGKDILVFPFTCEHVCAYHRLMLSTSCKTRRSY